MYIRKHFDEYCIFCEYQVATCYDLVPICVYCNFKFEKFRQRCHGDIAKCMMKNKESNIFKFLPYTVKDLRSHFESKFKPWMNWENRGNITKNWDNNDQSTMPWYHVVPQFQTASTTAPRLWFYATARTQTY